MILIDTSVLVDFFKGNRNQGTDNFREILKSGIPFGITSVIYQEVLQGARSEEEYETLRRYLSSQRFFHPKHPVVSYEEAARIYFLCRRNGVTVRSTLDCLIARIVLENELILLHNDRDFDAMARFIGLRLYPAKGPQVCKR